MRSDAQSGGEAAVALPCTPAPALGGTGAQAIARPRWWLDALAIVWLAFLYDLVTNLAPLRLSAALGHGRGLLAFERTLHLAPERALNDWLLDHHALATALSYYYDNAHFVVTFGLLAWLWWRRADLYRPLRTALVAINLIGLAVFWLYPVAPPRMLAGFGDVVASSHTFGSWHTGSLASAANQLAAMPSLHLAWAAWCGVVLWQLTGTVEGPGSANVIENRGARLGGLTATCATLFDRLRHPLGARKWVRALALLYPCFTAFVVIATGNHYLLDVLAGLATAALALALVRPLGRVGGACHKLVTKSPIR